MSILFTSDTHFHHTNVIKYCNRPFSSVEEMNEVMIERWNSVVQPEDIVYHLGDVCFANMSKTVEILNQLHGKIYLIRGNHDKDLTKHADKVKDKILWIKDYFKLIVDDPDAFHGKRSIVLSHYAFRVWDESHYGSWHLYGHSHGTLPGHGFSFDIGVDCHNFYPLTYQQIKDKMKEKGDNDVKL